MDEPIQQDLIEPQSVAPTPDAEPTIDPKTAQKRARDKASRERRRQRASGPQTVDMASIAAEVDVMPESVTGTGRGRGRPRAKKITGDDVAGAVELLSGLYVMLSRRPYWLIPAEEVKPWAGDAAELLNRIPSKYVSAAAGAAGYFAVGSGIYASVKPRLEEDARQNAAARQRAAAQRAAMNGTATDTNADAAASGAQLGTDVPWAGGGTL